MHETTLYLVFRKHSSLHLLLTVYGELIAAVSQKAPPLAQRGGVVSLLTDIQYRQWTLIAYKKQIVAQPGVDGVEQSMHYDANVIHTEPDSVD